MDGKQSLLHLASQLAHDLTANGRIREITTNTDLIGEYAEHSVRQLIKRAAAPLRVSSGAIVYEGICPDRVPQIDTIIWSPMPVPAVYEIGDFALVPRGSAIAFLEVKRSDYSGASEKIAETLARESDLLRWDGEGVIDRLHEQPRSLGVVCTRRGDRKDEVLDRLVADKRVVVLLREEAGVHVPDPGAMFDLLDFIARVRCRAKILDGEIGVNFDRFH